MSALLSKAGCNMGACHGNLNGKGGFRLSLRGEDPRFDFKALTRDSFGRRADHLGAVERSLIKLLKPTGRVASTRGGQPRFPPRHLEAATTLQEWIRQGANDDEPKVPKLRRLLVFPSERILAPGSLAQQLVVTAEFADGSSRDVTRQASYDVSDPTVVSVSHDGRVEPKRPCETTVAIRYLDGRAVSRLAFLPDRPGFVWKDVPARNVVDTHVFAKLKSLRITPLRSRDRPRFSCVARRSTSSAGSLPRTRSAPSSPTPIRTNGTA